MNAPFGWSWSSVGRGALAIGLGALAIGMQLALAGPAQEISGRAEAIEGDSLHINGAYIRINGIDAPAFAQTCTDARGARHEAGRLAAERLAALVAGAEVSCRLAPAHVGQGVLIAACSVGGEDLAGRLVDEGLVRPVSSAGDLALRARGAQTARRGVWAMNCRTPSDRRATPSEIMGCCGR